MASRTSLFLAGLFVCALALLAVGYAVLLDARLLPIAAIALVAGVAGMLAGATPARPPKAPRTP